MKTRLFLSALAAALALAPRPAPARPGGEGPEDGFVPLFNGKDLSGWHNVNGSPGTWSVRDGRIVCTGKPICVLRSDRQYENFILELDWVHVFPKGNSGCFVWSDPMPARGQPFTRAIECQILDGTESESYTSHGDVFAIHGAVMTPDRPHPRGWMRCLPSERRSKPAGEWNHYRITCAGGALKLAVNGKEVSGGSGISPRKGYICLESEGSEVHFRNVRIRELPPSKPPLEPAQVAPLAEDFRCLYTGVDLSGWRLEKDGGRHWRANDWRIDFDGKGGGALLGESDHGDFVLIADWRFTAEPVKRRVPVVLPTGEVELGSDGKEKMIEVDDAGEGALRLRGSEKCGVVMSCWPIGSGEVRGYRTDAALPAEVRAAATPKARADAPLGEWNRFTVTLKGDRLTVDLNGKIVVENARLPGLPPRGPIALEGGGPIQLANLFVRPLE